MNAPFADEDRRLWGMAGAAALGGHAALLGLLLWWARPAVPPVPEPVMLVELPPLAGPAPVEPAAEPQPVRPEPLLPETPPIDVPLARMPLPPEPVVLPVAPPRPSMPVVAPQPAPAAVATPAPAPSALAGNDPKARKQEADYFAQLAAHLNRRKTYPVEAKKARQQGIVTVRFTVARSGQVSDITIKRGSGHDVLDRVTLELVQRVAPFPAFPASMQRDSITLSLPIDYSLKTN